MLRGQDGGTKKKGRKHNRKKFLPTGDGLKVSQKKDEGRGRINRTKSRPALQNPHRQVKKKKKLSPRSSGVGRHKPPPSKKEKSWS